MNHSFESQFTFESQLLLQSCISCQTWTFQFRQFSQKSEVYRFTISLHLYTVCVMMMMSGYYRNNWAKSHTPNPLFRQTISVRGIKWVKQLKVRLLRDWAKLIELVSAYITRFNEYTNLRKTKNLHLWIIKMCWII